MTRSVFRSFLYLHRDGVYRSIMPGNEPEGCKVQGCNKRPYQSNTLSLCFTHMMQTKEGRDMLKGVYKTPVPD